MLVQENACCIINTKALWEPMLTVSEAFRNWFMKYFKYIEIMSYKYLQNGVIKIETVLLWSQLDFSGFTRFQVFCQNL